MEIVKELNLNGNPQVVPNGSLMYAKNIKLSDDGTYITNDDGFDTAFAEAEPSRDNLKVSSVVGTFCKSIKVTDSGDGEHLVGYINCPNEIVLFVYKKYGYIDPDTQQEVDVEVSEIYRAIELKYDEEVEVEGEEEPVSIHSDKLALYKVPTAWKYDNGKIIGTYTYNVYGHLIVAIAESDSYTIEIDSETGDEIHVPFDKQLMTIDLNDSSIDDPIDKYSCAPNIPICNLTLLEKIKGSVIPHGLYNFFIRYKIDSDIYTTWFPIGAPQYALSLDFLSIFNHTYAINDDPNVKKTNKSILVNTNKDSYYNFNFNIQFDNIYTYKGFQIGYILQTDDNTVGRIWNEFSLNKGELIKNFVFNGGYIEEISIEELTKNVLNIYNIKSITSYNSKLYLANFKETEYNINPIHTDNPQAENYLKPYADDIETYLIRKVVNVDGLDKAVEKMNVWKYTIDNESVSIKVQENKTSIHLKDFPALVSLLNNKLEWVRGATSIETLPQEFDLIFSEEGLILSPYNTLVPSNLWVYDYNDSYTGPINNGEGFIIYKKEYISGTHYVYCAARLDSGINIEKTTTIKDSDTFNTDNVVKTLMPNEVYAFYVHYVRADGSYTNGIPLENKVVYDIDTYPTINEDITKFIGDIDPFTLSDYNLNHLADIDLVKNKYLYEIFSPISQKGYTEEKMMNKTKYYFDLYLNNKGKRLFKTPSCVNFNNSNTENCDLLRLGVRFENITCPPGFIGVFFSYEKLNSISVYQGYVSDYSDLYNNILVKSNDVEFVNIRYDGALFIPSHKITNNGIEGMKYDSSQTSAYYGYINNAAPVLSNSNITFNDNLIYRTGTHGGIIMNLTLGIDDNAHRKAPYVPAKGTVGTIILFNTSIYSNEIKELIPFGPIKKLSENIENNWYGEEHDETLYPYINSSNNAINYDISYPSFLTKDNILLYKQSIFINENLSINTITENEINKDSYFTDNDYADIIQVWKYSNINSLALSIKKSPENKSGVINNNKNTINVLVEPINASDLFKLESCYIQKNNKSYTNYNVNKTNNIVFNNIIRASYPIRNESNVNSWRLLDPLSYYVIDSANGEIVNMFGASSAFYIHTKNNLLVTTSNAKINADNTEININNNNIFDVDPKEIFTSDLGYGGLKYQECNLFSQFGYIWYDTERYKLFRYDNGRLIDINSGVDELLKKYKFEKCYINIDNENNRILFAFDEGNGYSITLGYDTLGGKWLSLYDFTFDRAIHTANYAMFNVGFEVLLYKYSKSTTVCDYKSLARYNSDLPFYGTLQIGGYPLIKYCCFDIIFNPNYTIPKVLNSISWIHEYITRNTLDNNHPAELKIINRTITNKINDLDGLIIDIYSDSVDSGLLEVTPPSGSKLNDVADPTNPNAYKYPYYNKGVWNYSYFRNNIVTPVTDVELAALAQAYGVDVNTLKNVYKITDKNGNQLYVDGNPAYAASDLRSLIYGKYIAVRFIFKNTNKLKFDNLVINVQKY